VGFQLAGGTETSQFALAYIVSPSQGETPAEPHPCRERFIDPRCAAKTLANAHSADQRSAARLEPRRPKSSPVFSQDFRESQGHWAAAWWLIGVVRGCLLCSGRAAGCGQAGGAEYTQSHSLHSVSFRIVSSSQIRPSGMREMRKSFLQDACHGRPGCRGAVEISARVICLNLSVRSRNFAHDFLEFRSLLSCLLQRARGVAGYGQSSGVG
jgi:hypothetical protein